MLSVIALAAAGAAATPESQAASPLKLSGSFRIRYETIDDQPRAGFERTSELVNLRTTFAARYETGPLRIGAELYDSRAYGAGPRTPISTNEVNALELVQAWIGAAVPDAFGAGTRLDLQAGRFLLNLGSRRLVAADDYRNTTNSYTGVRADVAGRGSWKASFVYVLPQSRRPDDAGSIRDNRVAFDHEGFDLILWGGLLSRSKLVAGTTAEVAVLRLTEQDRPGRPTRDRRLTTFDARLIRPPASGRFDYEIEAIYQIGEISTGQAASAPTQTVRAGFARAEAGYSLSDGWKPRLSLALDYASGDRPGGAYGRFDTLFGMRRADLAPAGLYNAVGRTNLLSPALRVEVTPEKRLDGFISWRPLWLASRTDAFATTGVRDPTGRSGQFAGHQFDSRLRYLVLPWLRLEIDAVLLAKGRFLRNAPNAPAGKTTRYLSLNATAAF